MGQTFTPQVGKQTDFLECEADIVIYGGGAGSGKTQALLLEPLRYFENGKFRALILRRTRAQIRNQGGLWDEATKLYNSVAHLRNAQLEVIFESGMVIKFSHMQHENDKYNYDGSQIPLICFDELQTFSDSQFRYMLSRNRSDCGVKSYIRCTCNPYPYSWILKYIGWYINEDGFPIQARSGHIRWFIAIDDHLVWGDTREELVEKFGIEAEPKSLSFIPATVYDNPALLRNNPGYLANLKSLSKLERLRLLDGNWHISVQKGDWFDRKWVKIIDRAPSNCITVRYWDRAATVKDANHRNPDATAGIKLGYADGIYYVINLQHFYKSPHQVRNSIIETAKAELATACVIEQDPGQAGKTEAQFLAGDIMRTTKAEVRIRRVTTDKLTRFKSFSSAAEAGLIYVVVGEWNNRFFEELEAFETEGNHHDDIVDASSGAFNFLHNKIVKRPLLIAI